LSSVFNESEKFSSARAWDAVVHLCRRICLLRHSGRDSEAGHLHDEELPRLLAVLPATPDLEPRVQALFVEEDRRMADAHALAEMLAPIMIEHLRSVFTFAPIVHAAPAAGASAEPRATAQPSSTAPSPAPRPVRTTAPSIADFIDDMLSQERPARRAS
jgi:hypothetical protein